MHLENEMEERAGGARFRKPAILQEHVKQRNKNIKYVNLSKQIFRTND
jgi:hypothetical protein